MTEFVGIIFGVLAWFIVRYLVGGIYTVGPNERAVKTVFGRAERLGEDYSSGSELSADEQERFNFPKVRVIQPGGPYFKMPWEDVYKVSVATETASIGLDPENPEQNNGGRVLEAVTKDQLNTGITGQIRYYVSEHNLYAYLFGIKNPSAHIMGFFHSILREKIANFEAPQAAGTVEPAEGQQVDLLHQTVNGISINDLRKNLRDINDHMEDECASSATRYGIILEAALITGIDPPNEVEAALAAINTAHNQVSSDISLAQAAADQKIVQSRRAVEIEQLNAQAEVEPLTQMAKQLSELKRDGGLLAYLRNVRLGLFNRATTVIVEADR